MQKSLYVFILSGFVMLFMVQCRNKEISADVEIQKFDKDSILKNDKVLKKTDSVSKITDSEAEAGNKEVTSIRFDKEVYDFGECTEGDKVIKSIEFTNTGKLPLVINQTYGSCGCTVPKYNKEPIAPGKKGAIEIQFDSSRKPGANTKSVMIEANTNPSVTSITFSVKVNTKAKKK
ncbi:MAG: DUF1573 domain-containing protein [Sphingobacteriales bacterium]|jgi:hypothetical protein|nr:DUF1573 domain-containing protein [Sphingobacteriales bacterium]